MNTYAPEPLPASTQFLSLRMVSEDTVLLDRLQAQLGGTKSDIVKQALRLMAEQTPVEPGHSPSLYALGADRFGRYGDATRQSADIKTVVRQRLSVKRLDSKRQASA